MSLTTIVVIFGGSLLGIAFLFWNKSREERLGKPFIRVRSGFDFAAGKYSEVSKIITTELPRHALRESFHFAIRQIVALLRKVRNKIYPKISHIVDTVKGVDIPKSDKPSSSYLSDVSAFKKTELVIPPPEAQSAPDMRADLPRHRHQAHQTNPPKPATDAAKPARKPRTRPKINREYFETGSKFPRPGNSDKVL